ncbi:hypothetical protein PVAP13_5KG153400 [Panicum virgatum]|uniref:Uncharacterized protein n=1 Tax=Panicum virgatum TaxID=38727 RepID=A0A8T0SCN5_PANVG|nr:hypothetical protein PVAP13_5KG153400 [Panicum virgatum]
MMVASGPPINTPPSSFLRNKQLAIQNQWQAKSESSGLQGGIREDGEHDEAPPRRHPRRRGSRQPRCHRAGRRCQIQKRRRGCRHRIRKRQCGAAGSRPSGGPGSRGSWCWTRPRRRQRARLTHHFTLLGLHSLGTPGYYYMMPISSINKYD